MILSDEIQSIAEDAGLDPVYGEKWQQSYVGDSLNYPALFLDPVEFTQADLGSDKSYNDLSMFICYDSAINEMHSFYAQKIADSLVKAYEVLGALESRRAANGTRIIKSLTNIRVSEVQQIAIYDIPLTGVAVTFNIVAHADRC